MPTSTRRQARTRSGRARQDETQLQRDDLASSSISDIHDRRQRRARQAEITNHDEHGGEQHENEGEGEMEDEDDDRDVNGTHVEDFDPEPFPPPGLKEISSLASWTVSSAKPGSGVVALRSPDTLQFWQSDGPQPHLLSIHFFKLVSIVSIRIFLDFENDESYTPTKILFLAGMGEHDLQEFAEMNFEQPTGWIDVDFSNVGPAEADDVSIDEAGNRVVDWSKRPALRAFLVQVKILENHQNGKDTHLRGVQLFARDESNLSRTTERVEKALPSRTRENFAAEVNNIALAGWMTDPDLR